MPPILERSHELGVLILLRCFLGPLAIEYLSKNNYLFNDLIFDNIYYLEASLQWFLVAFSHKDFIK
jgi:hypothetical protein